MRPGFDLTVAARQGRSFKRAAAWSFGAAAFLMFILDKSTLRDRITSLESASVGVMAEQPGSGPEYQMFIHGRYD